MSKWTEEEFLERRASRRAAAEHRFLERRERLDRAADELVGELMRQGRTVYYINQLDRAGNMTGRMVEFKSEHQAIEYLIRNHYV